MMSNHSTTKPQADDNKDPNQELWGKFCTGTANDHWYSKVSGILNDLKHCIRDAEAGDEAANAKLARFTAWRLTQ